MKMLVFISRYYRYIAGQRMKQVRQGNVGLDFCSFNWPPDDHTDAAMTNQSFKRCQRARKHSAARRFRSPVFKIGYDRLSNVTFIGRIFLITPCEEAVCMAGGSLATAVTQTVFR